jgi:tellurite resistance protein TerC
VLAVNAFALLGLRHLYYLIGGLLDRLAHLSAGLAGILAFIGAKLLIEALAQNGVTRLGPVRLPHISTGLSLCVIGGILAIVTVSSLVAARRSRPAVTQPRAGVSRPGAPRTARSPHRPVRPSESGQLAARSVPRSPRPGHAYPP